MLKKGLTLVADDPAVKLATVGNAKLLGERFVLVDFTVAAKDNFSLRETWQDFS